MKNHNIRCIEILSGIAGSAQRSGRTITLDVLKL